MRCRAMTITAALVVTGSALLPARARAAQPVGLKPNRIAISYEAPQNPAHREIYETLRSRRVLERFKEVLSPLKLPTTLRLKTAGCDGQVNAWYEESDHSVTVCYEYVAMLLKNAPEETTAAGVTHEDAIVGPTMEVFLHETAHALFSLLKVPILGREEDAADQLAAYLMLQLDQSVARKALRGVAFLYHSLAQGQKPGAKLFADAHGLSAQRFYNLLCMAYGADSEAYADVVEKGYLPQSRADDCEDEYAQIAYAYKKLITPYIDPNVRKRVKPVKLFPSEGKP